MTPGFDMDALLEDLATRVAKKLSAQAGRSAAATVQTRLLSVVEAGTYLGRSDHSVRHLISTGKIPAVKLDQRIFVDVRDLDRVIEGAKEFAA